MRRPWQGVTAAVEIGSVEVTGKRVRKRNSGALALFVISITNGVPSQKRLTMRSNDDERIQSLKLPSEKEKQNKNHRSKISYYY